MFLALAFFGIGVPRLFTSTAALTLFLQTWDASVLPYTYIGAALAVPLVGAVYLWFESRVAFRSLLLAGVLFDLAALVALRLAFDLADPRWVAMALTIWVEVEWVLVSVVFWGLASRVFQLRQAKRSFGIIAAGEPLAILLGGLCVPLLLDLFPVVELLWMSAAGLAVAATLIGHVAARETTAAAPPVDEADDDDTPDRLAAVRDARNGERGYLRLLFALVMVGEVVHYFVDNAFYAGVERRFPDAVALGDFIGLFLGVSGGTSLVCSLLLSGWLLRRHGVRAGLLMLPVLLVLCSAAAVAVGWGPWSSTTLAVTLALWLLALTKLLDEAIRSSIYRPAFLTLYQPLATRERTRAQALVEGVYEPLAAGVAGVCLLLIAHWYGSDELALLLAAALLGLAWCGQSMLVWLRYLRVLGAAIRTRRFSAAPPDLGDPAVRAVLARALASPRTTEVLYALTLLERDANNGASTRARDLDTALAQLIEHPAPEVRLEALDCIERLRRVMLRPALRRRLGVVGGGVEKAALLRAAGAVGEAQAVSMLSGFLADADRAVRDAALVSLIRHGGIEGMLAAGEMLLALIRSSGRDDRLAAARALQTLGFAALHAPLRTLLEDVDPQVREGALHAAAAAPAPELHATLLRSLAEPRFAAAAGAALAACGAAVVPELLAAWRRAANERQTRVHLLDLLGRIGAADAVGLLLEETGASDARIALHAVHALRDCSARAGGISGELLEETLLGASAAARYCLDHLDALRGLEQRPDAPRDLVRHALLHELERCRERILVVAGMLCPDTVSEALVQEFATSDAARRAYALEVLESGLPRTLRGTVMAALETEPADHGAGSDGRRAEGALLRLARGWGACDSPWLRACALHTARVHGLGECLEAARGALEAEDAVLREGAVLALAAFGGSAGDRERLRYRCHDGSSTVAAVAQAVLADRPPIDPISGVPMLLTIEKTLVLKSVTLFEDVPDEYLAVLAARTRELVVAAGETFIREGDLGTTLYVIVEGEVAVSRGGRQLAVIGERDVVGELAALDPEPRSASVTALCETRLLRLDHEHLEELMSANVALMSGILKTLCRRVRGAADALSSVSAHGDPDPTGPQ